MSDKALQHLLRSGLDEAPGVEDAVMEALLPGPDLGLLLREALVGSVDLADAVMDSLSPMDLGSLLREGLASDVDLEASVMAALPTPEAMAAETEGMGLDRLLTRGLVESVDLREDIFAALDLPSFGALLKENLGAPVSLDAAVLADLETAPVALREHLSEEVDLSEEVMSALEQDLQLGELLREGLSDEMDLSDGIFGALETDPRIGEELREALSSDVDLSDGIFGAIRTPAGERVLTKPLEERPSSRPRPALRVHEGGAGKESITRSETSARPSRTIWRWAPAVAAAAALVVAVLRLTANDVSPQALQPFAVQARNEAEVEDLSTAATASAQVMQFEDNGPTFILVDEGETSNQTVPL